MVQGQFDMALSMNLNYAAKGVPKGYYKQHPWEFPTASFLSSKTVGLATLQCIYILQNTVKKEDIDLRELHRIIKKEIIKAYSVCNNSQDLFDGAAGFLWVLLTINKIYRK
jgi:hypothetical protein